MTGKEGLFEAAVSRYKELGVDVHDAIKRLEQVEVSLPCWQGDDVRGFEGRQSPGGGILVTGAYPGRAETPRDLRKSLEKALHAIPGKHRVNVHAMYLEAEGGIPERNRIGPEHYENWVEWAKGLGIGLDFNATCFSHPRAESGYTLASFDEDTRRFWIEHVKRSRRVAEWMGRELGTRCVHNLWIPDGSKDITLFRKERRKVLKESLDEIFSERLDGKYLIDSVESKLFGIGSEAFVAGSHDFYLAYAVKNGLYLCLDMGHYHPTESIADKISAIIDFVPGILLHVSRGVRWDSDHVVILDDSLREVALEVVRAEAVPKVKVALDFFDATLDRTRAWIIGANSVLKAFLFAFLEPGERIRAGERKGDHAGKLELLEEAKALPWGTVWEYFLDKRLQGR